MSTLVVTFALDEAGRAGVAAGLYGAAEIVCLPDVPAGDRARVLGSAAAILTRNTDRELEADERPLVAGARLLQFVSAGVDFIDLRRLPPGLPLACNAGAFAEPMAEHGLAMALAAAKRLRTEQDKLAAGTFDQFRPNRLLAGGVCGILGLGGVGRATARLFRAIGMRVEAVSRGAHELPEVERVGPPAELVPMLARADVAVICAALTRETEGMIGARELAAMKPAAILVNLARGEIVDEAALHAHLEASPEFTACIDAWWVEPVRHGEFRTDYPFLSLPNVVASPHNSASVPGALAVALERAAANVRRALLGERPRHLVSADDLPRGRR